MKTRPFASPIYFSRSVFNSDSEVVLFVVLKIFVESRNASRFVYLFDISLILCSWIGSSCFAFISLLKSEMKVLIPIRILGLALTQKKIKISGVMKKRIIKN